MRPGDTRTGLKGLSAVLALLASLFIEAARAQQGTYSEPAVGTTERSSILETLRRAGDIPDRIFVVRSMRVQDGWAWVVVDPESRDRSNHYETESVLLKGGGGDWAIVDRPCEEDGCDPGSEVARIRAAHPEAPAPIFPP